MSPNAGGGGGGGVNGISANEYSCAHGTQINFGYLTPCLTFVFAILTRTWSLRLQAGNLGHDLRERVPGVRQ
jgi:hypothetical protein